MKLFLGDNGVSSATAWRDQHDFHHDDRSIYSGDLQRAMDQPLGQVNYGGFGDDVFFQFFAHTDFHHTPEVLGIFRVPAVKKQKFLEIMGMGRIIILKWLLDELETHNHVIAQLIRAHHQTIEDRYTVFAAYLRPLYFDKVFPVFGCGNLYALLGFVTNYSPILVGSLPGVNK